MYRAWCVVCHGADGTGRLPSRPVRIQPLDFTDCRMATREPDADWALVIAQGGYAAGLSSEMPAFEQLSDGQVAALVHYLRSFCRDASWPSGNASARRALFTIKAFPETEAALVPMVSHGRETFTRVRLEATYATRIGHRAEIEVGLPAETVGWVTGRVAGIGDVFADAKYAWLSGRHAGWIVTTGVEGSVRTGSWQWGFGEGTNVLQPYVAAGLRHGGLSIQGDLGARVFQHQVQGEFYQHVRYDAAVSRDQSARPSAWAWGIEINGSGTAVGITPFVAKGLTRTGSLSAAVGVRLPITAPFPLSTDATRWTGYLLWDYSRPFRARR